MKEVEEDTKQLNSSTCSCVRRINVVKAIYTTQINIHIHCSLSKTPMAFLKKLEKNNPKICVEWKKSKITIEEKIKAGSIILPDYKIYCKALITKTSWYWHKRIYRLMEQNGEPIIKVIHVQSIGFFFLFF